MYIANRIKDYRRQYSLTQEEFGALVHVSPQAVSKWERGESYPDVLLLPTLARLLACSVNDFFLSDTESPQA